MNQPSRNCFAAGVAALLGLGATMGAGAAQPAEAPMETVSYDDLDLSRSTDVQTLYYRLERASARVCGQAPASIELSRYLGWSRCYRSALDAAVRKISSPELQALNR